MSTAAGKPRPAGWHTTLTGRKVPMCDGTAAHCRKIGDAYGSHFCPVTEPTSQKIILDWVREQVAR